MKKRKKVMERLSTKEVVDYINGIDETPFMYVRDPDNVVVKLTLTGKVTDWIGALNVGDVFVIDFEDESYEIFTKRNDDIWVSENF